MPQRKKAKTKKGMKKSINGLWKSLQKEKLSHARATKHVAHLNQVARTQAMVMQKMAEEIESMGHQLIDDQRAKNDNADFVADLITRIV
ncbi:MAG: hypothetical protein DRQ42_06090 [Gammaproteobacteria bacterium]|nr:MAG: hypothetical protein DRQ42_06090 [Gammaproteobacteria bacterium]